MELIKTKLTAEPDKQNRGNWLELAKKDERGVPMPTGVHRVKLLKGEEDKKINFRGIEEDGIMLYFDEAGIEKKYFVPIYVNDKNSDNYGKFHYLFEKFGQINEGSDLEMEYVRKGKAGYVDVRVVGKDNLSIDDIPVVEDNVDNIPPLNEADYN